MRLLGSLSVKGRAGLFNLLLLSACGTTGAAPDAAAPAWSVEVTAIGSGALTRCARDGQACAPLLAGAAIEVGADGALLRSGDGARASLVLDAATTLELGENTVIALEPGRSVRIESGTALVTRAPTGGGAPVGLHAGGASIELDAARADVVALEALRADVVALEALRADRADVTVRRGKALARGSSGAPVELRAGDGARVNAASADVRAALGASAAAGELGAPARVELRPRGLGSVRARIPSTETIVDGVRLVAHRAKVTVSGGLARTEIEEEFQNDGDVVLEGRFVFPLPRDAGVSRLALWVADKLVEGEIVERDKATTIMRAIADDTLRPRDPALLEWAGGGELALTIYPIPPKGRRKVLLAYDQPLVRRGGETRFVLPLSLGSDRAPTIDELAIDVDIDEPALEVADVTTPGYAAKIARGPHAATVHYEARALTPISDFVVRYERPAQELAAASVYRAASLGDAGAPVDVPKDAAASRDGFVALRISATLPKDARLPTRAPIDRAIVLDVSQSQSRESLALSAELALELARQLDPDETFVLLACDSACATFPATGRAYPGDAELADATKWLAALAPLGSSDLAGAIAEAAARLAPDGRGQLVYLGDGAPTSGELSEAAMTARVRRAIEAAKADLRLVGIGRGVDDDVLGGIARNAGATYEAFASGRRAGPRIADLARTLRAPALTHARLELPAGIADVFPRTLPNLSLGQELLVAGRVIGPLTGTATLTGRVGGADYALSLPIVESDDGGNGNPAIPRLWAEGRIHELASSDAAAALRETIALSKRFHVMSRITSLLVLENDRMFAEFGIARTVGQPDGTLDQASFGGLGSFGTPGRGDGGGLAGIGAIGQLDSIPKGESQGFGNGHGRLGGSHAVNAPQLRIGATTVNGRLPPEVIRRIVRQNFGRFRLCYESGLRRNPELQGTVAVRFVIGRDGSVSTTGNGGSDLPDDGVVACVVRSFGNLSFPQPEGGIVTVRYPIVFSPGDLDPGVGPPPLHSMGDDKWMTEGEAEVAKLEAELAAAPMSRAKHEALVRGLLAHGRFDKARDAAARLLELDPDLARAHELSAYAAAAHGDAKTALGELDSEVELAPALASRHLRAARAFEAAGDERRACAHWRSLGELAPASLALLGESLRCRARVLGEKESALAEAKALKAPGLPKLVEALEAGAAPAYVNDAVVGYFEATMSCADGVARCPTVLVIAPGGTVLSPWTPQPAMRSSKNGVSFANLERATYRTLLVGGDPDAHGDSALRVLETTPTFPIHHGGTQAVVATIVRRTEYEQRSGSR